MVNLSGVHLYGCRVGSSRVERYTRVESPEASLNFQYYVLVLKGFLRRFNRKSGLTFPTYPGKMSESVQGITTSVCLLTATTCVLTHTGWCG